MAVLQRQNPEPKLDRADQRDLRELTVDQKSADAEMASLRRSAAADPLLSVPPSILVALAELGAEPPVRRRILELVLAALASCPVFAAHLERLAEPAAEPELSARAVSDTAKRVTFNALGFKRAAEFREAAHEQLRIMFGGAEPTFGRWTGPRGH